MKPHVMHVALAVDELLIKRLLWTWKGVLWKWESWKTDLRPLQTSPGLVGWRWRESPICPSQGMSGSITFSVLGVDIYRQIIHLCLFLPSTGSFAGI